MEKHAAAGHLTDEALFGLALPPAGEPEALPAHLLQCSRCGRALQEWKAAVRDLAREEVEPLARRTSEQWRAAEDRTLERLRREGKRRSYPRLRFAIGLAATLLLAVLLIPWSRAGRISSAGAAASSELSPADAADDELLRDVARLSRGDDAGALGGLVPDPTEEGEGRL